MDIAILNGLSDSQRTRHSEGLKADGDHREGYLVGVRGKLQRDSKTTSRPQAHPSIRLNVASSAFGPFFLKSGLNLPALARLGLSEPPLPCGRRAARCGRFPGSGNQDAETAVVGDLDDGEALGLGPWSGLGLLHVSSAKCINCMTRLAPEAQATSRRARQDLPKKSWGLVLVS